MNFASIALKNVRNKFSSYLIYFVSIAFSVLIFHLFCSLYYNPTFENYRFGTGKMSILFRSSAIAVLLFSVIFILYSGNYFIKTQKKEIAVYSLLGMRKGQIAVMMFLETLFIGVCAIVLGVLCGYFLSGFFARVLLRFMAVGTSVTVTPNPLAVVVTLVAFLIIFVISAIRAYGTIYRYRLIDLFAAAKQSEGIPGYSKVGAVISVLLLACGYWISMTIRVDVSGLRMLPIVFIAALFVTAGTFFLFRNLIPAFIKLIKRNKNFYYKTDHFISVSQIAFRLKANSGMLSVVSILTAITITIISASFSFYSVLSDDATKCYAPFSFLAKNITEEQYTKLVQTVEDIGEVTITGEDKIKLIKVSIQNDEYTVHDQETGDVGLGVPADGFLMSESIYLKIIQETGVKEGSHNEMKSDFKGGLKDSDCYFIDGNVTNNYCIDLPGKLVNVSIHDSQAAYNVTATGQHKYLGALDTYKHPTVVVSDKVYQDYLTNAVAGDVDTFYGFLFDDNMMSGNTVDAMCEIIPDRFDIGGLPGNISYIGVYKANFALFGSYAFIGFFLGVLFLLASGSVMYYKLITEAKEETQRYELLKKTGMKKKEILSSIAKQLGLVFGFPLIIGLLHTMFGLFFYVRAMGEMGKQTPSLQNALLYVLIFVFVYSIFYGVSVKSYYNIVQA